MLREDRMSVISRLPIRTLDDAFQHATQGGETQLWVREACVIAPPGWTDSPVNPKGPHRQEVGYLADSGGELTEAAEDYGLKKRSSKHMPRWASRFTLKVSAMRLEPLQNITDAGVWSEGVRAGDNEDPREAYGRYWDEIIRENGHRVLFWEENPEVYRIVFNVQRQ